MDLTGTAAIVTGAGSGVGRATAVRLAALGADVVVNFCTSREGAAETVALVEAEGRRAVAVRADVTDDGQVLAMVDTAMETFGRLDVLVNNAGTTRFVPAGDLQAVTDDAWWRLLDVNLIGPFRCRRAAAPAMLKTANPQGAEIVNVSSVAGLLATGSSIPYCASKAGLNNLTVALARTLAPQIRVNAVAPGFITGRWLEEGLGARYEAVKRQFEEAMPLGRVSTPDDVARAVTGLVSGSDLVTGQILACDGGMTIVAPVQVRS